MPRRLNYEFTSVAQIKILKAVLVIKSLTELRFHSSLHLPLLNGWDFSWLCAQSIFTETILYLMIYEHTVI